MRIALKYGLLTLSTIALLFCGLLAWFGFGFELNKGSGSKFQAVAWAIGFTVFGMLTSYAFYFLAKSNSLSDKPLSHGRLLAACLICFLFAACVMLIGRNMVASILVPLPLAALAALLPIFAYKTARKTS